MNSMLYHQKIQIIRQSFTPFINLIGKTSPNEKNRTLGLHHNDKYIDLKLRRRVGVDIWRPVRRVGPGFKVTLALEDEDWLSAGEYEGDFPVEFSPKRLLIYLKQLCTSTNFESKSQRLEPSQLLGVIPISSKKFGEYTTISFDNPLFKNLNCSSINELDFDFKIEWANGKRDKLDNHSQPIDLILEVK